MTIDFFEKFLGVILFLFYAALAVGFFIAGWYVAGFWGVVAVLGYYLGALAIWEDLKHN
jgi:hypothetical protein